MAKSDTINSGRAFDDLALRRIGWVAAWMILGLLALCVLFRIDETGAVLGKFLRRKKRSA